jgi:lysophospholipase L1-like esterase
MKKKNFKLIFFFFYFLAIFYFITCVSLYTISAAFFKNKKVINLPIFREFQINFSENIGNRVVWQGKKDCVEYDEELIYVPKINFTCEFSNVEYKTNLNFDEEGRKSNYRKILKENLTDSEFRKGIAILGDSIAMGYGVNDDQVLSVLLEKKIKRPVYNLAVSSYATDREIIRLSKSKLINYIDTIVIFYSENDIGENLATNNLYPTNNTQDSFNTLISSQSNSFSKIKKMIRYAIQIPLQELRRKTYYIDWREHEEQFIKVLKRYPFLHEKKIYVVVAPPSLDRRNYYKNFEPKYYKEYKLEFLYIQNDAKDYYLIDGHPNYKGHEKLAEFVYNKLKSY